MSKQSELTRSKIERLRANLHKASPADKEEILALIERYERDNGARIARENFLAFILKINEQYKVGAHHRRLAELLQNVSQGDKDRVAVSMAPRFGKSLMLSEYFPAWFIGNHPDKKIIIASHTSDLAVDFGRKVRNLISSPEYRAIFPSIVLSADSKSAGRWSTSQGGEFYAVGVGGALAGRGADLLVIDDPFSEQDVLSGNYEVFEKVYDWYAYGARTRLMPGGRVVILHTRWMLNDLIGKLLVEQGKSEFTDKWEYVEFPAILNEHSNDPERPEKSLWPEQWPLDQLIRTRASMPVFQWQAQFQQSPTNQDGAIVKKEWFKRWTKEAPPTCQYVIMSLDAAQEKNKRSDFSALTTWGVFYAENEYGVQEARIILLNAINRRVDFPELKDMVMKEYKEWNPDTFIIEKRSNGAPLFQELRRTGVPVVDFTPSRTQDKIARLNAVADIIRSGLVYLPHYRWAEELAEQMNAFPAVPHDDLVDSTSMALARFRNGGFIRLPTDYDEQEDRDFHPVEADYYRIV